MESFYEIAGDSGSYRNEFRTHVPELVFRVGALTLNSQLNAHNLRLMKSLLGDRRGWTEIREFKGSYCHGYKQGERTIFLKKPWSRITGQMQQQGTDQLANHHEIVSTERWKDYFEIARVRGISCSRIDLTFDDYGGLIPFAYLKELSLDGNGERQAREIKGRLRLDPQIKSGEFRGMNMGSRTSDLYIRIYQKQDKWGSTFTRFEAECKGKLAEQVLREFGQSGIEGAIGCVASRVGFRNPSLTDSNPRREGVPTQEWWSTFVGRASVSKPIICRNVRDYATDSRRTVRRYAKRIVFLVKLDGIDGFKRFLDSLAVELSDEAKLILEKPDRYRWPMETFYRDE